MTKYKPEGVLFESTENKRILSSHTAIEDAYRKKTVLEARVCSCSPSHDLYVDLGVMLGIIPHNEAALGIDDGSVRDIAIISRVNKPVCFIITGFEQLPDGKKRAVLSRKAVQAQCKESYIDTLIPGDIIETKVTYLESFGAFVDIGCGLTSLIPIDSISVSRISHPRDRFYVGECVRAAVLSVNEDGRITLSHKELLGTWKENAQRFSIGEIVSGTVRSVENYGIFVELAPNLAGLAEYKPGVVPGMQASIYIKNIIPQKMKIKLIIVDAFNADYKPGDPEYYFTGTHIERFEYAPEECGRSIATEFE